MANNRIIQLPASQQFRSFSLRINPVGIALLPDEHELAINTVSGYFVLLNWDMRHVVADGQFRGGELPLMLTLLDAWPSFVPNEKLLQVVTGKPLDEVAQALEIAPVASIEPLRHLIESCQDQLHAFGVDITDVHSHGYKLSRYIVRKGEQA